MLRLKGWGEIFHWWNMDIKMLSGDMDLNLNRTCIQGQSNWFFFINNIDISKDTYDVQSWYENLQNHKFYKKAVSCHNNLSNISGAKV